ncbi:MAG TPA: hypothetical protein VF265_05165 [Nevskiaceae bacterium]
MLDGAATQRQLDPGHRLPDGIVFDLDESHKGYRINKMAMSLTREENRRAYKADQRAYMRRYGLSDAAQQLVLDHQWARLNEEMGANTYFLIKLAFMAGEGLYRMGAQMRGESFEEFLASRNAGSAR